MKHIVMFSGGIGSWAAAKRVAAKYGTDDMLLLFADTRIEDDDLYRFIIEAVANIGAPFLSLQDGRTPWEVCRDERFIANTQVDICSRILKRDLLWKWTKANCGPQDTTIYLGIDWTESHRLENTRKARPGWRIKAPLCEEPLIIKLDIIDALAQAGINPPRLYKLGFPHNNCGGLCFKAGQAQFRLLLHSMPERYAYHEEEEQRAIELIGKDVAIMKDRRGGKTKPLSMKEFRERLTANPKDCDEHEWGGCGCALD